MSLAPSNFQLSEHAEELSGVDPEDRERALATLPSRAGSSPEATGPDVAIGTWVRHVQLHRTGDEQILAELVEEYRPFALAMARRFQRRNIAFDDLVQVAMEGLVAALRRFDPDRSIPFTGFAGPTIIGSLKRHYRDAGWALRVPRRVHDLIGPAREIADDFTAHHGREPTEGEVAERLGVEQEELERVEQAASARAMKSLDEPATDDESPSRLNIGTIDTGFAAVEKRMAVHDAIARLDDRQRHVLHMYFFEERSQVDIAEHYGVSQMQVSRWLHTTLGQIRARVR